MRRRGHQEIMIRHLRESLAELKGERFLVRAISTHLVGFVHDNEVPATSQEGFLRVIDARNPRDGSDDLVFLLPRIHSVICTEHITADHLKTLAELVLESPLPLEGKVGWRDDKGSFYQSAYFELFDEKARHDRFAGAWVVGQQKP